MKSLLFPSLATVLALAGAAQAGTPALQPDLMAAVRAKAPGPIMTPKPATGLDMSSRHARFDVAYAHAGPARIPGVARTSVDRSLLSDDVIGSLGFLCGPRQGQDQGRYEAREKQGLHMKALLNGPEMSRLRCHLRTVTASGCRAVCCCGESAIRPQAIAGKSVRS